MSAPSGRFEVDPDALIRNGRELGSLGAQLGMLSDSLGTALSGGIASGLDPVGLNFGLTYADLAQNFANYLADAATALKTQGYLLEATGFNYKNADAASTVGGPGPTGGVGEAPAATTAADAPFGPNATIIPPPPGWAIIQALVRLPWPSGVPALMSVTAAQWKNYASGFTAVQANIDRVKAAVALDVQHIDEGPKINEALQTLHKKVVHLAGLATGTATQIEEFAKGVQEAQDAIRRILKRMSFSGLIDTVKGIFTGDGARIAREIARDAEAILNYLQSIVKAIVGILGQLTEEIGDAATALQKWVEPRLEEVFGEEVGGALSAAFKAYTDFQVGVISGVIGTVAGVVAMADPDTWIGMYDVAMMVVQDPSKADDVLVAMGREFFAVDQLTGDHPGRGVGQAGFNILSSFAPGGPLSKAGLAAKGMKAAKAAMAADGKLSKLGDLSKLGSGKGKLDGLDSPGPSKAPEVPEFTPTPGIPESVVDPKGPKDFGAPVNRPGSDIPAASPESPAPRGYHGGGGDDPPDPPGRATGPSESGPTHSAGPSPQSPSSAGPGHAADSPHTPGPSTSSQSPSSGGPATPNATHTPESSGPAYTPDSSPAESGNGQTPAGHEPSTPQPHNDGNVVADDQRPNSGIRDDAGQGAGNNHSSSETRSPGSGPSDGPADQRAHMPTDHQPAHGPETQTGGHERGTTEGNQSEQPRTTNEGTADRQESAPAPPMGVFAGGIPSAPHAPGPSHGTGEGLASPGKTPAAESSPPRNSESKTPQGNSSENPRKQPADSAGGPASRSTPTAPVEPGADSRPQSSNGRPSQDADASEFAARGGGSAIGSGAEHDSAHHHPASAGGSHGLEGGAPKGAHTDPEGPSDRVEVTKSTANGSASGDEVHRSETPSGDHKEGNLNSQTSEDKSRTYSLMDQTAHRTSFAPEQLLDNRRVSDALAKHGVSKSNFVDLINMPTDVLTPGDRHLINAVRDDLPAPTRDTVMQKIIPPGYFDEHGGLVQSRADDYIMGNNTQMNVQQVGGAVTVAGDTSHLSTPEKIYDGLRLDYADSPFERYDPGTHLIRFQADPGSSGVYEVPRNSDMGGGQAYDSWSDPFTGNGFTKSADDVIPEYVAKNITMRDGAEMWEVLDDGTQRLVAVLKNKVWIPQGN